MRKLKTLVRTDLSVDFPFDLNLKNKILYPIYSKKCKKLPSITILLKNCLETMRQMSYFLKILFWLLPASSSCKLHLSTPVPRLFPKKLRQIEKNKGKQSVDPAAPGAEKSLINFIFFIFRAR
jgi:hypothetical protein